MKTRNKYIYLVISISIFSRLPRNLSAEFGQASQQNDKVILNEILKNCADYCERLSNSALYFVCREKIEERIYHYPISRGRPRFFKANFSIEKNSYLYDYQLIKKAGKIQESRTLLEKNGKKLKKNNAKLETKRFISEKPFFGPVGLFSKHWQAFFHYKIIDEEEIDGIRAFVLEAVPMTQSIETLNYGKAWIGKKDYQMIKIEIEPKSLGHYESFQKEAKGLNAVPNISIISYFDIEKKGLRFPSKITMHENYIGNVDMMRFKRSETIINYDDYKFFEVEVRVEY